LIDTKKRITPSEEIVPLGESVNFCVLIRHLDRYEIHNPIGSPKESKGSSVALFAVLKKNPTECGCISQIPTLLARTRSLAAGKIFIPKNSWNPIFLTNSICNPSPFDARLGHFERHARHTAAFKLPFPPVTMANSIASPEATDAFIIVSGIISILFAIFQFKLVSRISLTGAPGGGHSETLVSGVNIDTSKLIGIYEAIREGADSFLKAEYTMCAYFIVAFGTVVLLLVRISQLPRSADCLLHCFV
jgi:hypothetical protein